MVTKLYKIYPSASINTIDTSNVTSNIRWNIANTEFIVEFLTPPHGNTVTLTHDEAAILMQNENWAPPEEDLPFNT